MFTKITSTLKNKISFRFLGKYPKFLKAYLNYWPPFLGAGIRVDHLDSNYKSVQVSMNLKAFNTNYVGVHFGGSIYSMCDPWWMLLIMENLGKKYVVWDQKASVHFVRPGKGRIYFHIELKQKDIIKIKSMTKNGRVYCPVFPILIKNNNNKIVAKISKTIFIQEKKAFEERRAKKD